MKIAICLDYSSFTEKVLSDAKQFIDQVREPEITVIHVVDQSLFLPTTGFEVQLSDTLEKENADLRDKCSHYLGNDIKYIEEYGIPRLKIDEALNTLSYDLLIIGSHSRHGLGERLVGGVAEHLLRNIRKPILIIS